MKGLQDDEAPVSFGSGGHSLEVLEALSLERCTVRNHTVAALRHVLETYLDVSSVDNSPTPLSPSAKSV